MKLNIFIFTILTLCILPIFANENNSNTETLARNFSDEQIEGYIQNNGIIKWLPLHYKRKNESVLSIKECSICPILPICIGGCSQHLLERKDNLNCPLGMKFSDKINYAQRVFINKLNIL